MLAVHRISPSLLLALCLVLTPTAVRAQATAPPAPPASAPSAKAAPSPKPAPPANPRRPGAPGSPGTPGAPPAPAPESLNPDLLQFQLKFPEQKGKPGGSATGSAATLDYKRDDFAVLTGSVHVHYQDIDLRADKAEMDLSTRIVTAEGNVVIDQGPRRMTGKTAKFSLDTKTGTLTQATAQVAPDYYFSGTEITKIGDHSYTVNNGIFTSCNQKVPDWSFRLGWAQVDVGDYAHIQHVEMLAKKLPVLYTPYILWPAKTERSSGFLIPNIGYSDRRGAQLGLAYYQTLGRSYDTTFHLDLFSKNFLGLGDELRYHPTEGTQGGLIGYVVRDSEPQSTIPGDPTKDQWRWKVEWNHVTNDLPWGMRGVVHYLNFSDFNFFRDFERDFDRNTLRFIDNRATVTGNWGPNLVNFLLNDRETFIGLGNDSVDQRKLPELDYRLRSTRLGRTPFYLGLDSSVSYLDLIRPGSYKGRYGRFDLFPQLTLPIRSFPWLSLSVTGGERLTWYGDSLNTTATAFTGQSLTRTLPFASAEIVGPSISRIFDWKIGGYGKFKNVIEPRFTYTYQGTFDDQPRTPQFDEVDTLFASNSGRVALDSRVLGKPKDEKGSAREVLLFELARSYSFDPKEPLEGSLPLPPVTPGTVGSPVLSSQAGPLESLLRFNPSDTTSLKLEATYSLLYRGIASTGLSGNYGSPVGNFIGVTWFTRYEPSLNETLGDQIRLNGAVTLLPRRLRLEGQINYDLQLRLLQQQRYVLSWTSQCYGVRLELRDFRTGTQPQVSDKEIRFSLSLKNVGTFLDLTSRSGNSTTAVQ